MPWEPLPQRHVDPAPLGMSIERLMTRLAGVPTSAIELIMDRWSEIVGDAAGAACAPVKVSNGVLTVRTDDAIWGTELRWLEPTIIERIAELDEGTIINSVKVVIRPG
jgi:predicted nucleic acid-binding Zn ribbon protein